MFFLIKEKVVELEILVVEIGFEIRLVCDLVVFIWNVKEVFDSWILG